MNVKRHKKERMKARRKWIQVSNEREISTWFLVFTDFLLLGFMLERLLQ